MKDEHRHRLNGAMTLDPKFEPLEVTLVINREEDLQALWAHLNEPLVDAEPNVVRASESMSGLAWKLWELLDRKVNS